MLIIVDKFIILSILGTYMKKLIIAIGMLTAINGCNAMNNDDNYNMGNSTYKINDENLSDLLEELKTQLPFKDEKKVLDLRITKWRNTIDSKIKKAKQNSTNLIGTQDKNIVISADNISSINTAVVQIYENI